MRQITLKEYNALHPDYKGTNAEGKRSMLVWEEGTGTTSITEGLHFEIINEKKQSPTMGNLNLKAGGKYTTIYLNALAMTSKDQIVITGFCDKKERYTFKEKGKRKEYYLSKDLDEMLIFEGHEVPGLKVDTETNFMRGNACYNFLTQSPEEVRELIETKNINPLFRKHGHCLYFTNERDEDGNTLYPDNYVHSAVIDRVKEKERAKAAQEEPPYIEPSDAPTIQDWAAAEARQNGYTVKNQLYTQFNWQAKGQVYMGECEVGFHHVYTGNETKYYSELEFCERYAADLAELRKEQEPEPQHTIQTDRPAFTLFPQSVQQSLFS